MNNQTDEIKEIKNRIWHTKKARMCMEARVIRENKRVNSVLFIASILLLVFSLSGFWEIQIKEIFQEYWILRIIEFLLKYSNIINVILSLFLLCFTIKLDIENQVNRVWLIRHCYTELAKLEYSTKSPEELNKDYQDILVKYENHDTKDYIESISNKAEKENKLLKKIFYIMVGFIISFLYFK